MENRKLVSVIVPVYNAENTIARCMESILDQEYDLLEVVAVDDGSKDLSAQILDGYAENDQRVRVIHQKNAGVSAARNAALEAVKGEYIRFLDADDWIPEDSIKLLVRAMEEDDSDLVVGEFYRVVGENLSRKGSIREPKALTREAYSSKMMDSPADLYYGVLWNKLYKRSIIEEKKLRMDPKLDFCEDFVFNLEYILHCKTITPLQVPVYYYVKTEGSLVAQSMNLPKIIAMKTGVFEYYDRFYRSVLNKEEYAQERANITRFLFSAAQDDFAIPLMPGTKKLGEEKVPVYYETKSPDPITAAYYLNKVFDGYLNTIAMKYSLERRDIRVFHALKTARFSLNLKEIEDYTSCSQAMILLSLQKLSAGHFVEISLEKMTASLSNTENARALSADVDLAMEDLQSALGKDLSEEEKKTYETLNEKVFESLFKKLEER